jgi:hypothetical protein
LDEATVLLHAIDAARDGCPVPLNAFLPDDVIQRLGSMSRTELESIQEHLPDDLADDVTPRHVELYVLAERANQAPRAGPNI